MISKHKPPFLRTSKNASYSNGLFLVALLPCVIGAVFSYGLRALVLILTSASLFYLLDLLFAHILGNHSDKNSVSDVYSLVSGIIFALLLPPNTSLLVVVIGAIFGTLIVKQLFGGIGNNLFNPAAAARLFVELVLPEYLLGFAQPFVGLMRADTLFTLHAPGPEQVWSSVSTGDLFFVEVLNGSYNTLIGLGSFFTLIIGMLYLMVKKTTKPYVSVIYILASVCGYCVINHQIFAEYSLKLCIRNIAVFVITSGVVFAATYLLAVYSNVPISFRGALLSGITSGVIAAGLYNHASIGVVICVPTLVVNLMTPITEYLLPHRHNKKASNVVSEEEVPIC